MNVTTTRSPSPADAPPSASAAPTPSDILSAIAKIEQLFPAPRTLSRALVLLRQTHSDLDDIAALINRDPALAADVLRCANSAFYRRGEPVHAISEAVQKIGFQETIRLLNLVVAQQTARQDLDCYGIAAEDFWAESLFAGLLLENLAKVSRLIDPDEAYTAGLLRYIGRLAINQAINDLGCGCFWQPGTSLTAWEIENVGMTQGTTGAVLLCNWHFPDAIADAVAAQDAPSIPDDAPPLTQAMHFTAQVLTPGADLAYLQQVNRVSPESPAQHPFARAAGLSSERLATVFGETHEAFTAVRSRFV